MAGAAISINFRDGQKFTNDQKHRLGIVAPDELGDNWTYVQLGKDVVFGEVLIDHKFNGAITTALAKGADKLIDTGGFSGDNVNIKGAIGWFPNHRVAFYVRRRIDNDTVEIVGLADNTGIKRGGSPQAVAVATGAFSLILPGYVFGGTARPGEVRGVAQAVGKKGQFGFIRQTGWGGLLVDDAANVPAGGGLVAGASGKAYPISSTPTVPQALNRIARMPWNTVTVAEFGGADKVIFTNLEIVNEMLSYSFPDDDMALNLVNIQ